MRPRTSRQRGFFGGHVAMGAASCSCVQSEAEPSATEPKVTLVYSEQRLSSGSKDGKNDGGKVQRERSKSKQKSFEVKPNGPNGEVKNDVPSPFDVECPKPGQRLNVCIMFW